MSEPSSLYLRVKLTEKNFAAFKNSSPVAPHHYGDWQPWLSSQKFYGEITDAEIQQMNPSTDLEQTEVKTVGNYLTRLEQDVYAGPIQSRHDTSSNTWTLCVMGLSENYKDFILILSLLRGIEQYKDLPGEDFILIYPYVWEENAGAYANAYVTITADSSGIVSEIPVEAITEANQGLGKLLEDFRSAYHDDDL